jgi:glycosyltransferase involved in cell wall biosynthesis
MKVLLNFVPLKSGGGLQVGMDFLEQARAQPQQHEWFIVATADTPLAEAQTAAHIHYSKIVPRSLPRRLWFENFGCRQILRTQDFSLIYTQFGPHWPAANDAINVVGCAYSNLCYPEIDFWSALPPWQRYQRRLLDRLRRQRIQQADAVIFETEDLADRAVRYLNLPADRVHVVQPSVSSLVRAAAEHSPTAQRCQQLPQGFKILLLSVYRTNKNFELLPKALHVLKERMRDQETVFVVTLPQDSPDWSRLAELAHSLGVGSRLFNFGPVPQQGCATLYRACQAVILPSQLESFSNSIAESWALERPLLVSDLPWARRICKEASRYFAYNDPQAVAEVVTELRRDSTLYGLLTENGKKLLVTYPNAAQRFAAYVAILERYAKR